LHILFTRPETESIYLAQKFARLGHQVSIFPILQVQKKKYSPINFAKYASVIFTSANAILSLDQVIPSKIRCFCVGEVTAQQAKRKGFSDVVVAGGNYQQLKEIILQKVNKEDGKLLYVRGEFISHDLEQDLRRESFAVDSIVNYTTIPSLDFDSQILEKLNKKLIDIIFIYSKKSAEHFVKLIFNNNVQGHFSSVRLRCLSENVLMPLQKIQWNEIKLFSPGNEEFCLD